MVDGETADAQKMKHIWLIIGPSGCGKSTVANHLREYHSKANKAKMASNIPLTDEDRWTWLIDVRNAALDELKSSDGVFVACSALKHKYRDVLRIAHYQHSCVQVHFIYLKADRETLQERVANRKGHYMKSEMVNSQFDNLEEPAELEWDATSVDVSGPPKEVQEAAQQIVAQKLEEYGESP